jgi:nucleoside-diphosphate-sugar epimerase
VVRWPETRLDDPRRLPGPSASFHIVRGDVLDPASLDKAVRGQDAVLCALGHKRWLGPSRILSTGTAHLVQAMRAHGVRRLVCESSLGVGNSFGRMGLYYTLFVVPIILPFYFWALALAIRHAHDQNAV